MGIGTILTRES